LVVANRQHKEDPQEDVGTRWSIKHGAARQYQETTPPIEQGEVKIKDVKPWEKTVRREGGKYLTTSGA